MHHPNNRNIMLVERLLQGTLELHHINNCDQFFEKTVRIHGPFRNHDEIYDISFGKELDAWLAKNLIKQKMNIQQIFAHEDKVIVYWILNCKYRKTNKNVAVSGTSIYRITKDRISEIWQSWDTSILSDILGKDWDFTNLTDILKKLSLHDSTAILGFEKYRQKISRLSKRERDCIEYLLLGKTAKEAAHLLKLSTRTVEYYYENLKIKLDCDNKRDLFTKAQLMALLKLI